MKHALLVALLIVLGWTAISIMVALAFHYWLTFTRRP